MIQNRTKRRAGSVPPGIRPPKIPNLMAKVKDAISTGEYSISNHAYGRAIDRLVSIPHVERVLLNGFHEKRKDSFSNDFSSWRYSICGKSPDRLSVRVIVTFAGDRLLIVTVINLEV